MLRPAAKISAWLKSNGVQWTSTPYGNWGSEEQHNKILIIYWLLLLWVKVYISESGILCLLPTPMKLCQPNVLACKKGKISDPSQFLTAVSKQHRLEGKKHYRMMKKTFYKWLILTGRHHNSKSTCIPNQTKQNKKTHI